MTDKRFKQLKKIWQGLGGKAPACGELACPELVEGVEPAEKTRKSLKKPAP